MRSIWVVPPIFGRMSADVSEGLGFHCDLNQEENSRDVTREVCCFPLDINWFDRSLVSRLNE